MNRPIHLIHVVGWILCIVNISSSISTDDKISKDEFGSLAQKQGVLTRIKRGTQKCYVLFDNRSGRQVQLWRKEKGKQKEAYRILALDRTTLTTTFIHHQWLATDKITKQPLLIDNKNIYTPKENTADTRDIVIIRRQGQTDVEISEKIIETMVVVDKAFSAYHKTTEDLKRYVLLLLKLASHVLHHPSLNVKITLVLSKLVVLRQDKREIVIKQYETLRESEKNVDSVCNYMNKIGNNGPVKFDHKLFLTRIKFGYSGFGRTFGMCSQSRSCSLVLDSGFSSAIVIAHELGHSFGMNDRYFGRDSIFVMNQPIQARIHNHAWSTDSKVAMLMNIRNYRCLNNRPSMNNKNFPILHQYPGVHYSAARQCQLAYNKKFSYRKTLDPCIELKCQLPPPYSTWLRKTGKPALNGTACGFNKWCLSGSCQTKTIRVLPIKRSEPVIPTTFRRPVHGRWGIWKAWTPCSKNCGPGFRTRSRECNNPRPSNGGRYCFGRSTVKRVCKIKNCPVDEGQLCAKEGIKHDRTRRWGIYDERNANLNCEFETNTCNWKNTDNDDQQDWKLQKGKTPSRNTGPSVDHTKKTRREVLKQRSTGNICRKMADGWHQMQIADDTIDTDDHSVILSPEKLIWLPGPYHFVFGPGQYIYFESSSPTKKGYKARLSSPALRVPQACLTFWYHMYGRPGMGTLMVSKSNMGTPARRIWMKSGNQGNRWFRGQIEINDDKFYQIFFLAKKVHNGYKSDIALDSIKFTPGPCQRTIRTSRIARKDIRRQRCFVTCTTIDNKSPTKIIHLPSKRQRNCRVQK